MGKGIGLTIGVIGGEVVGALIPAFWGAEVFSFISIVGGQIGALLGFLLVYKLIEK